MSGFNKGDEVMAATFRLPAGWFEDRETAVACCHHVGLSVCRNCQTKYADRLVESFGVHYWTRTEAKKADLLAMLAEVHTPA